MIPKFRAFHNGEMTDIYKINFSTNEIVYANELGIYYPLDCSQPMQSTGLFDKNGKEIFEGDILAYRYQNDDYLLNIIKNYGVKSDENDIYNIPDGVIDESLLDLTNYYEVKFQNTIPYSYSHRYKSMGLDDVLLDGNEFEVIGNIYENPELLEGNK